MKCRSFKPEQDNSHISLPDGMRLKAKAKNITGQRFGRLVAVRVVGKAKNNSLLWLCHCDCGNEVERASASLRKAKGVCSCGCYLKEVSKQRLKHDSWNIGRSYRIKGLDDIYKNRKAWATAVIREKGSKCEICGWNRARCDVHHILPRSKGGLNTINNGAVLCPNCHRELHEKAGEEM